MADTTNNKATVGRDANIQFGSGTMTVNGGTRSEDEDTADEARGKPSADLSRNVFVIHGRDEPARRAVFELLRRLDLKPLEWEKLVHATKNGAPLLAEVLDEAPRVAQAVVVLLTADDVINLHESLHDADEDRSELGSSMQPRPNVLIELGMALALHPKSTIILEFGKNLRPIADLLGRNVIRFNADTVRSPEPLRKIVGRLKQCGCAVDDGGTDWLDITPFADLAAYRRVP